MSDAQTIIEERLKEIEDQLEREKAHLCTTPIARDVPALVAAVKRAVKELATMEEVTGDRYTSICLSDIADILNPTKEAK